MKWSPGSPGSLALAALVVFALAAAADAAPRKARRNATRVPEQTLTGREEPPSARAERLRQDLARMTSESDDGLTPVTHPDGTTSVDLAGRFQNVLVAVPSADGGYRVTCHTGHETLSSAAHAADVAAGKAPLVAPVPSRAPSPTLEEK